MGWVDCETGGWAAGIWKYSSNNIRVGETFERIDDGQSTEKELDVDIFCC